MQWWEESWYNKNGDSEHRKLVGCYCPVCSRYLGERYEGSLFAGDCSECKFTFTFYPGSTKPAAAVTVTPEPDFSDTPTDDMPPEEEHLPPGYY